MDDTGGADSVGRDFLVHSLARDTQVHPGDCWMAVGLVNHCRSDNSYYNGYSDVCARIRKGSNAQTREGYERNQMFMRKRAAAEKLM